MTDSNGYRRRREATQFHDLIGFSLGKGFQILAQLLVAISLFGTGIAQIVASSSSQYSINQHYDKRQAFFSAAFRKFVNLSLPKVSTDDEKLGLFYFICQSCNCYRHVQDYTRRPATVLPA
jgi:hypothetical protein